MVLFIYYLESELNSYKENHRDEEENKVANLVKCLGLSRTAKLIFPCPTPKMYEAQSYFQHG